VLLAEIPTVLRADFYALAALSAAAIVVVGHMLMLPAAPVAGQRWRRASCCASWRSGGVGGFRWQKLRSDGRTVPGRRIRNCSMALRAGQAVGW
jgi:hypothetical protein